MDEQKPQPIWRRKQLNLIPWSLFDTYIERMVTEIRRLEPPSDVILGISRGGLIPAVAVAHALELRELHAMAIVRNTSDQRYSERGQPVLEWGPAAAVIAGRNVLIVDDIAGDGGTLRFAVEHVRSLGASTVRTAVVVVNAGCGFAVDLRCVEVDDWVVFPWERAAVSGELATHILG